MARIDGRTLDHKALEHIRILAVRRVVEEGEAPSAVIQSLGFSRTVIHSWLREFEDAGWDALVERIAEGPEPKLNEKQRQQVKRWILGKEPRQYGFDLGLWSRRIVPALIAERFGVGLGLTAGGRLWARLDLTPQKPLRRAYERDPQAVDPWVKAADPPLKRRAKRLRAMIFFLDEAGFQSDSPLGRKWKES
jgi:transposase